MQAKNLIESLRRFDAYPKTLEDFRVKTFGGATVTIISGLFMVILFLSELNYYLTKEVQPELFVDITRGQTKLKINLNVTFHHLPCAFLSIDAMDISGENQIDVDHNLFKQRLNLQGQAIEDEPEKQDLGDKSGEIVEEFGKTGPKIQSLTAANIIPDIWFPTNGWIMVNISGMINLRFRKNVVVLLAVKKDLDPNRCESCYGAETEDKKCCNTCEEVRDQYRKKGWAFKSGESIEQCVREGWNERIKAQKNEGCLVYGYIEVNKVGGNFHIAPGKSFQQHHVHVHDIQSLGGEKFNMSHTIHHLSFGQDYPGIINPLDGSRQQDDNTQMMFQYFVKIVPTTYTKVDGTTTYTNQFSVTKHSKIIGVFGETGLPGMFVTYELSPMMVKYTEKHRSFMHFLTGVCAIIGGIFTVAGLIDSMIYHSARALQKKIELGKAT